MPYPTDLADAVSPVMAAVDEFKASFEAKHAGLQDRYDTLEAALARVGFRGDVETIKAATPEQKAFLGFLRRGPDALPEPERKALTVGDDTTGGYLATPQFAQEIVKNLVLISPVRQAARVGQMTAGEILIPKRTGAPTGYWTSETGARQSTQSAYGQAKIVANEMAVYVDVSAKLLEDSAFDVQQEIALDLAEEFSRLEGAAFISGDGVGKPHGIITDTDITTKNSGTATTIADTGGTGDGLIDMLYDLPEFYRNRSTWMMNGTTLAAVRKLKDTQKRYIWQPGLAAGQPSTILGRPVIEAPDMPNEGAGLYPIAVGDFMSAYRIYDRIGLSILRDPYTQATSGLVRFHARRRVGGDVVKSEALRLLKCST